MKQHTNRAEIEEILSKYDLKWGDPIEKIKRTFKRAFAAHHPDKNLDDIEGAKVRFQQARADYDLVIDFIENIKNYEESVVENNEEKAEETTKFFDDFADHVYEETLAAWTQVLRENNAEKKEIYDQFLRNIENKDIANSYAVEILKGDKARLGAKTTARIKNVKRNMIQKVLKSLKTITPQIASNLLTYGEKLSVNIEQLSEFDITPTLAQNFAFDVINRGVEREFLIKNFATKGRTAADKTKTTMDDLSEVIELTQIMYAKLTVLMVFYMADLAGDYAAYTEGEKAYKAAKRAAKKEESSP